MREIKLSGNQGSGSAGRPKVTLGWRQMYKWNKLGRRNLPALFIPSKIRIYSLASCFVTPRRGALALPLGHLIKSSQILQLFPFRWIENPLFLPFRLSFSIFHSRATFNMSQLKLCDGISLHCHFKSSYSSIPLHLFARDSFPVKKHILKTNRCIWMKQTNLPLFMSTNTLYHSFS